MRKVIACSNIFWVQLSLEMKWSVWCSFLSSFSAAVFSQGVFTSAVSSWLLVGMVILTSGQGSGKVVEERWRGSPALHGLNYTCKTYQPPVTNNVPAQLIETCQGLPLTVISQSFIEVMSIK